MTESSFQALNYIPGKSSKALINETRIIGLKNKRGRYQLICSYPFLYYVYPSYFPLCSSSSLYHFFFIFKAPFFIYFVLLFLLVSSMRGNPFLDLLLIPLV